MRFCCVITPLLLANIVFGVENCVNFDVSITQKIENGGFHGNILWLLESIQPYEDWWGSSNCSLALQLNVSEGMFVNPDQLADLHRLGQISAFVDGLVNIETPEHESKGHTVYIFISERNLEKVSLQLPMHLRYQKAIIAGGFGKVNLPKPSLLLRCEKDVAICGKFSNIRGPCDHQGSTTCVWRNFTYRALFDDVELFVPIGNLDDYPIVSIVTLILGCAGCIYVLSILSTAPL